MGAANHRALDVRQNLRFAARRLNGVAFRHPLAADALQMLEVMSKLASTVPFIGL